MQKDGRKQIIEVKNRSFSSETFNLVENTRIVNLLSECLKAEIVFFMIKQVHVS